MEDLWIERVQNILRAFCLALGCVLCGRIDDAALDIDTLDITEPTCPYPTPESFTTYHGPYETTKALDTTIPIWTESPLVTRTQPRQRFTPEAGEITPDVFNLVSIKIQEECDSPDEDGFVIVVPLE